MREIDRHGVRSERDAEKVNRGETDLCAGRHRQQTTIYILYVYIIHTTITITITIHNKRGDGDAEAEGSFKKFCTMHVCVVGAKPVIDGVVVVMETTFGIVKECV